jgi:putative nucleotidyltransferase with HDIG domain
MQDGDGSISLSEILSALSYALDLTEGAVHGHALRSCLLGMRIAAEVKLPSAQARSLYFALLLKDIGCSSNAARMYQIIGGDDPAVKAGVKYEDWTRPHKPTLSTLGLRCVRGASIVGKLGMGEDAAQAIRGLDEHWDGGGYPDSVQGEQIPLLARICAVAQHLDLFSSGRGTEKAIETLEQRSGTWFDPELVRVTVSLHRRGALWANCLTSDSQSGTRQAVLDLDPGERHRMEAGEVDRICEAFADVVDAKSHFTFRHSIGVAEVASCIAATIGLSTERVQMVRRAALLHDIGKLGISNTILDKRSDLNATEWQFVYQHPALTRRILERVGPFQEMAIIAGEHHEKLDGSGYPNRLLAPELSLESRIVAAADVYAALSEDRPYRAGLGPDEAVAVMAKLVPNKVDPDCFDALLSMISSERNVNLAPMPHLADMELEYAFESAI